MPRTPEPWEWPERGGYYAWVKKRRLRLCDLADGITKAKKQLRLLLAESDEAGTPAATPPPLLVGEVLAGYLDHLRARRDRGDLDRATKDDVDRRTSGFAYLFGDMPADAVKRFHVEEWLATKTGWGPTSRHDGVGAIKSAFKWAAQQGLLDRNPLAEMAKPTRKAKRDRIPNAGDVAKVFEATLTPELRDILTFIYETGCRPKEARTLEACHFDRAGGRTVLSEHKTAKKTGKDRAIYLSDVAGEIVERLINTNPIGPIFLNSERRPWTHNAIGLAVRRLRERAGLGKEVVAYGLRHVFATDALAAGKSTAVVAHLMGHSDTRMLATYTHLSDHHGAMQDAIADIRPAKPGRDGQGGKAD